MSDDEPISVRADKAIATVNLAPEGRELAFSAQGGRIEFTVPQVVGHQIIELSYQRLRIVSPLGALQCAHGGI